MTPSKGRPLIMRIRDREQSGEQLSELQSRMWRDALRHDDNRRAETDDEREARLEREAIQAETA